MIIMKKNILLTGSTGFIGRNLKEQLNHKYNLLMPSHSELELTDSEAVKDYFKNHQINVVIHCATTGSGFKGRGMEKISQPGVIKKNLQMFFNIVNNSQYYEKLINFGTGAEYDKRFDIKKVKEEDSEHIPTEDYAFSKYIMSKYTERSNQNIIHLRFFAVFGKYEDYKLRFISKGICRNLLDLPVKINQNAVFDYLCIDDVVKIVDYFIQNEASKKIYNIGTGKPIELLTLAQKINKIANKQSEIIVEKEGLSEEYTCDNTRFINEIENFYFTPIDDAINKLYNYYKKEIGNLDMTKLAK